MANEPGLGTIMLEFGSWVYSKISAKKLISKQPRIVPYHECNLRVIDGHNNIIDTSKYRRTFFNDVVEWDERQNDIVNWDDAVAYMAGSLKCDGKPYTIEEIENIFCCEEADNLLRDIIADNVKIAVCDIEHASKDESKHDDRYAHHYQEVVTGYHIEYGVKVKDGFKLIRVLRYINHYMVVFSVVDSHLNETYIFRKVPRADELVNILINNKCPCTKVKQHSIFINHEQ